MSAISNFQLLRAVSEGLQHHPISNWVSIWYKSSLIEHRASLHSAATLWIMRVANQKFKKILRSVPPGADFLNSVSQPGELIPSLFTYACYRVSRFAPLLRWVHTLFEDFIRSCEQNRELLSSTASIVPTHSLREEAGRWPLGRIERECSCIIHQSSPINSWEFVFVDE